MIGDAEFLVIGSGPAGVSAAIPLVEAGRKVLMADGAGSATTPWPKAIDAAAPWRHMLGEDLEAIASDDTQSPKLSTPYARQITGSFMRDSGISATGFHPVGAIARGGLSTIWGGFVAEFSEDDLNSWPLISADLQPFYKEVVDRIGVSGGSRDDLSDFYGCCGELDAPPQIGPTAEYIYGRYREKPRTKDFRIGLARNAIITRDRPGRRACDLRQNCLWGCERGAIYDSRFDLASLSRRNNFRLLEDAFAVGIQNVEGSWDVIMRDGRRVRAAKVILAAGCLATTQLAIAVMPRPPGRFRLWNNPVMAMPFIVPSRLGKGMPTRGYSLAQLGYSYVYAPGRAEYVTGGIYEIGTLPSWNFTAKLPVSRRAGKTLFPLLSPAMLVVTCYFPGHLSNNYLSWSKSEGRVFASVLGDASPQLIMIAKGVKSAIGRGLRRLGACMLPGTTLATPGIDVHYGGTLPMGSESGTTVMGEIHGAPGIHVTDGSGFPSMPPKYPTLTVMANAARIGRHLASRR